MNDRPVVLLDVDGVLADFAGAYLTAIEAFTGEGFTLNDIDRLNIQECTFFLELEKRHPGLRGFLDHTVASPGFARDLRPYPHASDLIERLSKQADVLIVTSPWHRSRHWVYERQEWLRKHFGIDPYQVISASAKHHVAGDIFIDDHPEHIERWGRRWGWERTVTWDAPYNRGTTRGHRARTPEEAIEAFELIRHADYVSRVISERND